MIPRFNSGAFDKWIESTSSEPSLKLMTNWKTRIAWLILTNLAVSLSLVIFSLGNFLSLWQFLLPFCTLGMLIFLWRSKHVVAKVYGVTLIDPDVQADLSGLQELVGHLSARAGLEQIPEVGVYHSSDKNAFAVGLSRRDSMIAFSTALLDDLDGDEVAAVAAHEVGHIANGDMVNSTLIMGIIYSLVTLISIPILATLWLVRIVVRMKTEQNRDYALDGCIGWVVSIATVVVPAILLFLGSLFSKWFSRHREFKADEVAARLTSREAMISALKALSVEQMTFTRQQKAYVAFMIHSPPAWLDLLSTHPSIGRRIRVLTLVGGEQSTAVGRSATTPPTLARQIQTEAPDAVMETQQPRVVCSETKPGTYQKTRSKTFIGVFAVFCIGLMVMPVIRDWMETSMLEQSTPSTIYASNLKVGDFVGEKRVEDSIYEKGDRFGVVLSGHYVVDGEFQYSELSGYVIEVKESPEHFPTIRFEIYEEMRITPPGGTFTLTEENLSDLKSMLGDKAFSNVLSSVDNGEVVKVRLVIDNFMFGAGYATSYAWYFDIIDASVKAP